MYQSQGLLSSWWDLVDLKSPFFQTFLQPKQTIEEARLSPLYFRHVCF